MNTVHSVSACIDNKNPKFFSNAPEVTEVGNGDGSTTTAKPETTTSSASTLVMQLLVTMTSMLILVVTF